MYRPFYRCGWKWFNSSGLQGKSAKSWKWMESCITWLDNLNANEFDKINSFCPTPKFSAVTCKLGYYYKLKVYPKSNTDAMSIWCVVVKYGCLFQLTKHTIIVKWWMACNILKKFLFFFRNFFWGENLNISEINIISVEVVKILWFLISVFAHYLEHPCCSPPCLGR